MSLLPSHWLGQPWGSVAHPAASSSESEVHSRGLTTEAAVAADGVAREGFSEQATLELRPDDVQK